MIQDSIDKIKEEIEKKKKKKKENQNDKEKQANKIISEDGTLASFGFNDNYK